MATWVSSTPTHSDKWHWVRRTWLLAHIISTTIKESNDECSHTLGLPHRYRKLKGNIYYAHDEVEVRTKG